MLYYFLQAVGYSWGFNTYPLNFHFRSNYDIDIEDQHEYVIDKAHKEIKRRGFAGFRISKLEKVS